MTKRLPKTRKPIKSETEGLFGSGGDYIPPSQAEKVRWGQKVLKNINNNMKEPIPIDKAELLGEKLYEIMESYNFELSIVDDDMTYKESKEVLNRMESAARRLLESISEDVIGEGMLGLLQQYDAFKPSKDRPEPLADLRSMMIAMQVACTEGLERIKGKPCRKEELKQGLYSRLFRVYLYLKLPQINTLNFKEQIQTLLEVMQTISGGDGVSESDVWYYMNEVLPDFGQAEIETSTVKKWIRKWKREEIDLAETYLVAYEQSESVRKSLDNSI